MLDVDLNAASVRARMRMAGGARFVRSSIAACRGCLSSDTKKAVEHAAAAVKTARTYHRLVRGFPSCSLLAEALGWMANAARRDGDLAAATEALTEAEGILAAGAVTIDIEALLYNMRSRLLVDQGKLREALVYQELGEGIYRSLDMSQEAGFILLERGTALRLLGRIDEAIDAIEAASGLLDLDADDRTPFVYYQNLAMAVAESEVPQRAIRYLDLADQACGFSRPADRLRIAWARSRAFLHMKNYGGALMEARFARDGFVRLGARDEACRLSFETASILTEMGRTEEAQSFACESLSLAAALGLSQFQIAALRLLTRASSAATRLRAVELLANSFARTRLPN